MYFAVEFEKEEKDFVEIRNFTNNIENCFA